MTPPTELDNPVLAHQLDQFTLAYTEAMLWSSADENGDYIYGVLDSEDLAPETVERVKTDCLRFMTAYHNELREAINTSVYDYESAGQDFWLTRCGHGVGFWDRGLGKVGDELTSACEVYGTLDLYVGDDGKLYLS